ncbi:hypothetical protein K505DRAFT_322009 [Melanomma pulvis-pyrius CBS 109.77]|uniref:Exonuclease domain-containing protein n=1 Tax=Melanomma pulvis-pyrius CBS 109.77 TaxID=1314802 RepID=A0A6A6XQS7_9PLEO|nr:hypothetical protein K505DRAFT_322009 [Melanomma pulvis-pyrius CBS 109.77]
MWSSVPSFQPFGDIPCPGGARCEVPYCLFSHDAAKLQAAKPSSLDGGREVKRLKMSDGTKESALQTTPDPRQAATRPVFVGSIAPKKPSHLPNKGKSTDHNVPGRASSPAKGSNALPRSATRPISRPPKPTEAKLEPTPETVVKLYPRKLPQDPASFTRRLLLLQKLHQYMAPLNEEVARSNAPLVKVLHLSANQLNKVVIEEEERIALQHTAVYENVVKQRLVALKKMSLDDWIGARKEVIAKEQEAIAKAKGEAPAKPPPEAVNSGLTPKEEVIFLSRLVSPQAGLDTHGYVTEMPTETDLEDARAVLRLADGWEVCERCKTRFQVFPDRREEDGALTTGGRCTHHWGKRIFPRRSQIELPGPPRLSCCHEPLGSPGCTTHDTHVFKVSDVNRLSLIMPFIETPENDKIEPHTAVCFDCEMGFTTQGLEVLRITAVSWPTHKPLLDVLVRPLGQLLDVNTRFSGVTADQYFNAIPYDPKNPTTDPNELRIVDSPYVARKLLLSFIGPGTPVLGHALENDLNTIRLIHPTIVDTVILYPHHQGLPYRNGLRNLARIHLGLDIQQGGAAGHDSSEDARATGELVRFKVAQEWKMMKHDGWEIRDEGVFPPMPPDGPPLIKAPPAASMFAPVANSMLGAKPAEKRKLSEFEEGGEKKGDEPLAKRQG